MSGDPTFYLRHRFFSVFSVYGCFGHIFAFHYRPLVFTISLRKRLFPKYFRQSILNFFLWKNQKKPKKPKKPMSQIECWVPRHLPVRLGFFGFFGFFVFFGFFGLRLLRTYFWKKHFPLPALGIHYFPKKTAFPKIFPAIYFKLLSLKTGLYQRAVAFFLWRPDFFKRQ